MSLESHEIDERITGEGIVAVAGWCLDDAEHLLPKASVAALKVAHEILLLPDPPWPGGDWLAKEIEKEIERRS